MESPKQERVEMVLSDLSLVTSTHHHAKHKHGGMRAAAFIMGLQAFEIMAIASVGNNLITYVSKDMHYSLPKSANIVTNFVGTIFLISILGGFLSDSYLGSFLTVMIFGVVELTGYIIIAVQAHVPGLKPSKCDMMNWEAETCEEAKGVQALVLFVGLYTIAVGSGCLKPNMIAYGGDQFHVNSQADRRMRSRYFNWAYLSFCVGEMIALTFLVWIQTRCGMDVGFGVSAALMLCGLLSLLSATPLYINRPPQGSIFTSILQVLVAATLKRKLQRPSDPNMLYELREHNQRIKRVGVDRQLLTHTDQFRFLDKAAIVQVGEGENSPWKLCTVTQVEQVKLLIRLLPIFGCTIFINCILAQLQTFSVQQGTAMDNRLTSKSNFHVPPASLQAIPYIVLVFLVPLYDTFFVPLIRRITGHESGISQLERIGVGLFTSTFSMITAALVEGNRKRAAQHQHPKLSIFWIAPQFLIFGLSEMFTAVGLIDFFYSQSVAGMQSFLTALTYCSYAFGFFLSSALVSIVNKVTSHRNNGGWLAHNDLNKDHLDLFYWLLSALSLLNFLNYMFWSRWYSYNPSILHVPSDTSRVTATTSPNV